MSNNVLYLDKAESHRGRQEPCFWWDFSVTNLEGLPGNNPLHPRAALSSRRIKKRKSSSVRDTSTSSYMHYLLADDVTTR